MSVVDDRLDIGADAPLSRLYRPGTEGASASLFILGGITAVADNRQRAPEDGVYSFAGNAGRFKVRKGQLLPPGGIFATKDAPAIEHRNALRPGRMEDRQALPRGENRSSATDAEKQRQRDAAAAGKEAGQAAYDAAIADGKTKDEAKTAAQAAAAAAKAAALATDGGA